MVSRGRDGLLLAIKRQGPPGCKMPHGCPKRVSVMGDSLSPLRRELPVAAVAVVRVLSGSGHLCAWSRSQISLESVVMGEGLSKRVAGLCKSAPPGTGGWAGDLSCPEF